MRWKQQLLRAVDRVAIPNITVYLVALQAIAIFVSWQKPDILQQLAFDPRLVLQGEWWRAITFLFLPISTSPLWSAFVLYFYWLMGTALESHWGTARYNLYLLVGALMTIAAACFALLLGLPDAVGTNTFLMESIFLAFAALFPDFVIQLFFILPIRVKWLALATWILLAVQFLVSDWIARAMLLASVANFLLFFWREIFHRLHHGRRQMQRQVKRIRQAGPVSAATMHCCTICRATEKSHPQYEFRYCPECGNKCYCLDHLRDHVHSA